MQPIVPAPLPIPEWSGRPSVLRTSSFVGQFQDSHPSPARPVTAPSLAPRSSSSHPGSSRRPSSSRLPSLSTLGSQPDSTRLTLPAFNDTRGSISSTSSQPRDRLSWSTTSSRPSFEAVTTPRPLTGTSDRPESRRASVATGIFQSPFSISASESYYPSSVPMNGYPPTSDMPRSPLHKTSNYSRVLVGSLTSTCQRLLDPDGKPGLFFFAHDLGIRTEGLFTLKFTLTNLAS